MINNTENTSEMHENLEVVIQEIGQKSCDQYTDQEFERIGDAVMEQNHPNNHEMMDQMMGGEGSESLTQAHINMGKGYLNCVNEVSFSEEGNGVINMGYMMGGNYGNWGGSSMMYGGMSGLWLVNSLLVTILLVVLIRFFWLKGGGKK